MNQPMPATTRHWIQRIVLSLAAALAIGILAYLVARGMLGAWLLYDQQEQLRSMAGALRSGIDELPAADLRAMRLQIAILEAQHLRISMSIGFLAAAIAAVLSYIWQESGVQRGV
ncbi:MAG TPA: hypothetical protein PKA05_22060 [Roseiflexaceae bacterium]|nr:hypothetical protein [Roseiflexaceae bacterium]